MSQVWLNVLRNTTAVSDHLVTLYRINDNEGAAEMLIDTLGASIVNTTDSKGRTPLHAAAFTDHVECLQLLLSHNAQVNSVDSSGKTPLMMAAENGQTNTVGNDNNASCLCVT